MGFLKPLAFLLTALWAVSAQAQIGTYQSVDDFVAEVFAEQTPEQQILWLSKEDKQLIRKDLKADINAFRIKYWQLGETSVWIQDEIGKEYPITTGVVIKAGKIKNIKVLVYRETRGGEVRYPFFLKQFKQKDLSTKVKKWHIDSITGATLSVRAMKKMARRSLLFDNIARQKKRNQTAQQGAIR